MKEIINIKKFPCQLQIEIKDGLFHLNLEGDFGILTKNQYYSYLLDEGWDDISADKIIDYIMMSEGCEFFALCESDTNIETRINGGIFTFNADPCCVECEHIKSVADHIREHGIERFHYSEVDEEEFKVWCSKLDIEYATAIYKSFDNSMLLVLPEDIR